jgi:hypothetical protein
MTALAKERARRSDSWKYKSFTLASGSKAYKGGAAVLNASKKVVPASSTTGLVAIGMFAETVDATAGDLPVQVDLQREIVLEWFANATAGDAVAASDIGSDAYFLDDQTVTITATGRSLAGRIWGVDAIKGVALEKYCAPTQTVHAQPAVGAFASNDYAPASITLDAIYDVPTTGAASTITLPAAAPDGTIASFTADGTKNGHTVQYRDATGPTNLTTALTASKRHLVIVEKLGGKWFANAYVSP